jgi:hypothetical protein
MRMIAVDDDNLPSDEEFDALFADACIPCDRSEATRALFMVSPDGEVRAPDDACITPFLVSV